MNKTLEDNLGRLLMLGIFGFLLYRSVRSFTTVFINRDVMPLWPMAVFSQACGVVFIALIVYYTFVRLPSQAAAQGIAPRLIGNLGTFWMMLLVVLPPDPVTGWVRLISTSLVVIGTVLSALALRHLGRSFSIVATSRELKTTGAYGLVRHPLYAAELVMISGVVLGHGTLLAFAMAAFWLVLQIGRVRFEEGILRETFPEYEDYARRVPMMVPWLGRT